MNKITVYNKYFGIINPTHRNITIDTVTCYTIVKYLYIFIM